MRFITAPARALAAVSATVLLAACATGGGSSATSSASVAASGETYQVDVATTSAGKALTGEDGKTLYVLAKDSNGKSTCTGSCATNWPPFKLDDGEKTSAGSGVQAGWLGTLTRDDGSTQVSYNGHPLYYFKGDTKAGDANGQGFGGVWFIAAPDGMVPSASASAAASASASASSRY
jgi:predicted lipoprotein with Yx(FWY)xxD motif